MASAKTWPALDARGVDTGLLLAEIDQYSPTAVEDRGETTRVFFATTGTRDQALRHVVHGGVAASAVDVPDENWASRSQENITPVVVGRLTVTPPWHIRAQGLGAAPITVVIQPSMGFGTGHHATTRLCLAALQAIDVSGKDVLDVGTGSGVLAIAAAALGARRAKGIDRDADAIASARESLVLNPSVAHVSFELKDLAAGIESAQADVAIANLTGALLERTARLLLTAVRPGGTIIVSGLLTEERPAVEAAFWPAQLIRAWEEDEWTALAWRSDRGSANSRHRDTV